MKKYIIIFILFSVNLIPFNANAKVYYSFEKQGGKVVFNWFDSYIGYNEVYQSVYTEQESGNVVKVTTCLGSGRERCRHAGVTGNTKVSPNCTVETELLERIVNEMVASIDNDLLNGVFIGNNTKKIMIKSLEGNLCIIGFDARWRNGNLEGDSSIIISIDEVK